MTNPRILAAALPQPLPGDADARLFLFAARRMGAHGLHDAQAANAMLTAFGVGYRRPLALVRALMADLAAAARQPITIAPCCCARMTGPEAALLGAAGAVQLNRERAVLLLADLLGTTAEAAPLATLAAVAEAFGDAGRPL